MKMYSSKVNATDLAVQRKSIASPIPSDLQINKKWSDIIALDSCAGTVGTAGTAGTFGGTYGSLGTFGSYGCA